GFTFYWIDKHHQLHSFPTRRSSDLFKKITDSIAEEKQVAENKNAFIKYNVEKERNNTVEAQLNHKEEKAQKLLYMSLGIFASTLDRKSTRLTSSHVKLSYAVFCLKK